MPQKLREMKELFLVEAAKNKDLPIGGGMWATVMFHPEDSPASPYTEWTFTGAITRMPEASAPKLGKVSNTVSMEVDVPANANGVLYALGGFSGGLTTYVKDSVLSYEYNLFEINRTKIKAQEKLQAGKVKIDVESTLTANLSGPMNVVLKVNGKPVAQGKVPRTAAFHFTANDCLDLGCDLGSPVSLDYFDQAPFAFNGSLGTTKVTYVKNTPTTPG
jgi:arylsulfatase